MRTSKVKKELNNERNELRKIKNPDEMWVLEGV